MTTVPSANTTTTQNTGGAAAGATNNNSATNTATNQFLSILLTELQNQNPLSPTDTATFTTQLAQYSSLEQQINSNSKLDQLIKSAAGHVVSPVAYLGTQVNYNSPTAPVQNNQATWNYSTDGASTVTITVKDASGNVVYSGQGDATAGTHTLTLTAGSEVSDGTPLTITIGALDSTGKTIKPTVTSQAVIDAVETTDTATMLEAAGYSFDAATVVRITQPKAVAATPPDTLFTHEFIVSS